MTRKILLSAILLAVVFHPLTAQFRQEIAAGILVHRANDALFQNPRTSVYNAFNVREVFGNSPAFSTTMAPYLRYSLAIADLMDESLELSTGLGLAIHNTRFTKPPDSFFTAIEQKWSKRSIDMLVGARYKLDRLAFSFSYGLSLYESHRWQTTNYFGLTSSSTESIWLRYRYHDYVAFRVDYHIKDLGKKKLNFQAGMENLVELGNSPPKFSFGLVVSN